MLVSPLVSARGRLAKDISHSAIYRSSETFPFQLKGFVIQSFWHMCVCVCLCANERQRANKRFKERASNCNEMSQKGGLVRGYKPVVGVRAFLVEDQTEGSTTAKSGSVFFPHSASSYHCCSTTTAAHALGYSQTLKAKRKNGSFNCSAETHMQMQKKTTMNKERNTGLKSDYRAHGQNGMKRVISLDKTQITGTKTLRAVPACCMYT